MNLHVKFMQKREMDKILHKILSDLRNKNAVNFAQWTKQNEEAIEAIKAEIRKGA